jgi:hypothetical protein
MSNNRVSVLAFFKVKPDVQKEGEESPIIAATRHMIAETQKVCFMKPPFFNLSVLQIQEAGCIAYDLHKDLDDPLKYVMIEEW